MRRLSKRTKYLGPESSTVAGFDLIIYVSKGISMMPKPRISTESDGEESDREESDRKERDREERDREESNREK